MLSGKISSFGGPDDTGVSATETCALYPNLRCRELGTGDKIDLYCAMRWDYAATQRKLKTSRANALEYIR